MGEFIHQKGVNKISLRFFRLNGDCMREFDFFWEKGMVVEGVPSPHKICN
jgi:hypothetical protein